MLTPAEQYMLELINRTRLDPLAEVARNPEVADLNQDVPASSLLTPEARQPLAPNALLHQAAQEHGQWMLDTDTFSHTGAGGSSIGARIEATGYAEGSFLRFSGENLAWDGAFPGPIDPDVSAGGHHDALFHSPGHRAGMLGASFREAGIAQVVGIFTSPDSEGILRDWSASLAVHKFAARGDDDLFLTGVAFDDADGDGFYSLGEGLAGVGFAVAGGSTTTAAAGGYALQVPQAQQGTATAVTVTWGDAQKQLALDFTAGNVKLDLMQHDGGLRLLSSADTTLGAGASEAALLGIADLRLTGNDDGNLLIGNRGANLILGGAGDDTLQGGGGDDTLQGGGGWNIARFDGAADAFEITAAAGVLTVTDTRDGSPEGTNTLHDIHVLRFGDGSEQVIGPAPVAVDDTAEATEAGAAVTGNVLANDQGVGLGVVALDGGAPGTPVAGSFGTLTLQADGSFSYQPGSALPLPAGVTGTDSFTYTVANPADARDTATLTVTVTGTGDTPQPDGSLSGHAATRHGADVAEAGVTFTPAQGDPVTTLTGADGSFDLAIPQGMAGQLELHRDFTTGDPGLSISSAINVIRLALGLGLSDGSPVTPHDWIAADFTGDGAVTLGDGIGILRGALGLTTEHAARWVFVDAAADLTAIDRSHVQYDTGIAIGPDGPTEDLSLIGILIGQV